VLPTCILVERHVITLFQPPSWISDFMFHLAVLLIVPLKSMTPKHEDRHQNYVCITSDSLVTRGRNFVPPPAALHVINSGRLSEGPCYIDHNFRGSNLSAGFSTGWEVSDFIKEATQVSYEDVLTFNFRLNKVSSVSSVT